MKSLLEQEIAFLSKQNARMREMSASPTNSAGSFEFISANSTNPKDVDTIASYEKSWEHAKSPAIILLENQMNQRNNCSSSKENGISSSLSSNHLIKFIGRHQLNSYNSSVNATNKSTNRQNRPSSLLLFDNSHNTGGNNSPDDADFVRAYLEKCKQQQERKLLISTINNSASQTVRQSFNSIASSSSTTTTANSRKYNHVEQIFNENCNISNSSSRQQIANR